MNKVLFAVMGSPISHSLSPVIHQAFAEQFGLTIRYEKIQVDSGHLAQALNDFRLAGGIGANVTLPLKQEAYALCQQHSEAAHLAKAVNTLAWEDEQLWGDNTDGAGFLRDLTQNKKIDLTNKRLLIMGAGGATQGILLPLLRAKVASIILVNRSLPKAQALAKQDQRIKAYDFTTLANIHEQVDVIINATSASLQGVVPPLSSDWCHHAMAIDLAYDLKQPTVFVNWANRHGAQKAWDGLGMLVEQAALSFEKWHGLRPDTHKAMVRFLSLRNDF